MLPDWRTLETELVDITRRTASDHIHIQELANGDMAVGRMSLGSFYSFLSLTELAKELANRGFACATKATRAMS